MQASAQSQSPITNVIRVVAVKNGEMAGTWEFKKDTITVGRAPTADVRLDSKDISRVHCTLSIRPSGIFVIDGGSLNGTRVNGQKVSEQALTPRDLVQVGGFRFKAFAIARPVEDDAGEKTPAEDGPRVQLSAVPSADSATANDPTAPAIEIKRTKKSGIDPLPPQAEIVESRSYASLPDPLPPSAELADAEEDEAELDRNEKTPAQLPSFAVPPAASLAAKTPTEKPAEPASTSVASTSVASTSVASTSVAMKPAKQKMSRGTVLAIAFFVGSAMFFAMSVIGGAALFFFIVGS